MAPRSVIIDCDPGHDDALAILLALGSPEQLDVLAITAVAGNVPLALTERNARKVCELAGRLDLRVHAGCAQPLVRNLITAEYAMGRSGLDGAEMPEPRMPLAEKHAVDAIIEILRSRPAATVTLCPIGPLTNVAMALRKAPDIALRIKEIVLMGGAIGLGNVTPAAEFNIYVDPHAAQVVFEAGVPLVMHGLDVTHQALLTPDRLQAIRRIGTPLSRTVVGLLEFYGRPDPTRRGPPGAPLHDPCVIAYLLEPGLFRGRTCHVAIETQGEHTLGRTVVDWSGRTHLPPNATVISEIDADGFFALLTERLARLPLAPATARPAAPPR
ncbi:MAG TPA: nucleoside hydrolase [Geminicoccaceae bacterium]